MNAAVPILTTHTGSLPRPRPLLDLYAKRSRGEPVNAQALREMGDAAVEQAIAHQKEAGIDIVNNGEQTRDSFFLYLRHRLSGLDGNWKRPTFGDALKYPEFKARLEETSQRQDAVTLSYFGPPRAVGDIRYEQAEDIREECSVFAAKLAGADIENRRGFVSAPSPGILSTAIKNDHYATHRDFLAALGKAVSFEYREIVERGFLLQIDAPDLAMERHVTFYGQPLAKFLNFVEMVADTINEAIEGLPAERIRMHVCWGNYDGPHDEDVELADILGIVNRVNVGALVLPFANARHALDYRLLDDDTLFSAEKSIIAGVVDPLSNVVEHPQVVADRLMRVAEVLGGPTRLLAGTDCGFDSAAGLGRVATDVVWAKLASLARGAAIARDKLV